MERTKNANKNLENRILVTDRELTSLLGVGLQTAQAIATEAGAVVRVNRRKLNSVDKIKRYIEVTSDSGKGHDDIRNSKHGKRKRNPDTGII